MLIGNEEIKDTLKDIEVLPEPVKTILRDTSFYDLQPMLSYGAFLNFIIGGRGIGKTYGLEKWLLNRFITKGEQFIYLRRRKSELDRIDKESFFSKELLSDVFKDFEITDQRTSKILTKIEFTCSNYGEPGQVNEMVFSSTKVLLNGEVVCYLKNLSTWLDIKGASYNDVKYIFFDEVLIDESSRSNYIPDEVDALFNFLSSVFRRRKGCRVFLASNACNFNNPYFNFFHFEGDTNKRFHHLKDRRALIEFPPNTSYGNEEDEDNDLFHLMKGSKGFESSVNNEFQSKNLGNITKIKGDKLPLYCLYSAGRIVTVYSCEGGQVFVKNGLIADMPLISFNVNDVESGINFMPRNKPVPAFIRRNYYHNNIFYETFDAKVVFQDAVQKII